MALTFAASGQPPFSGLQYLYQDTDDVYSQWSNWQVMGIWTPDPWNVSVSPASGSASAGTFSATSYSDAGYQNLNWIGLMINTSSSVSANSCYVGYWPANGSSQDLLGLINDGGYTYVQQNGQSQWAVGTNIDVSNSQCTLHVGASTVSLPKTGKTLTVNLGLTFTAAFAGAKNIYMATIDSGSHQAHWEQKGNWTAIGPPTVVSMVPASGSGSAQTFTLTVADVAGAANISYAYLLVNASLSASGGCFVEFNRAANTFRLENDAGSGWLGPITLGSTASLSNSQCTITGNGASSNAVGNNLAIGIPITLFTAGFAGAKTTFGFAFDNVLTGSGWVTTGTWTVPVQQTITSSPTGLSVTVDGYPYTAPHMFQWQPGSAHTVATSSPQTSGGTWYAFSNWSDGGAISTHTIYASSSTDAANFTVALGYEPTITEINLAGVPLDNYFNINGSQFPRCDPSYTIQQCIKYFFNNNPTTQPYTPNNYIGQGVTGVRFFFTLQGGFGSTPFDANGNIQGVWVQKLQAFLSDLHSYGILTVTPTPVLDGNWGDPYIYPYPTVYDCTGSQLLKFFPWMPFGFRQGDGDYDCKQFNDAYSRANGNPGFWGWSPLFNLVNQIFGAIYNVPGLQLAEFDLDNEVNLEYYTVFGRYIYDNKHAPDGTPGTTDVLGTLRNYAASYNSSRINPNVITISVNADRPSIPGGHCPSGTVYGDSGLLMQASELLGALAGGWSAIGLPFQPDYNSDPPLTCGGTNPNDTYMFKMPVTYAQTPTVTDNHVKPCVVINTPPYSCTTQDSTSTAKQTYDDLWTFLQARQLTGNVAMMGETQSDQNCEGYTTAMATENVNGYIQSALKTNHASLTTMRIWNNDADVSNCYAVPTVINPPYNSNR